MKSRYCLNVGILIIKMETLKNMRPVGKKIFILPSNIEKVTPGGIIIPDTVKNIATEGIVVAIDPTVRQVSMGDTIIYQKETGTSLEIDGVTHIMFREKDNGMHAIKNPVTGELKLL